jgi:hypothetical protein
MKQKYTALEVNPWGTTTSRLTSPVAHVVPVRVPDSTLLSDLFYKLQFNRESEYTMLQLDFASQEMYLAALLGQQYSTAVNGTPFGDDVFLKAMLSGTKEDGTDVYSLVARSINIKRNQAKGAVLATLYGSGIKTFTNSLLKAIDLESEKSRVRTLAKVAFESLKGKKCKAGRFEQGVASNFFNWSMSNISRDVPENPILRQSFPKILSPKYMGKAATYTAQINYPVQAGCATLGVLSIFMTLVTAKLSEVNLIESRDWRFGCSVHDSYTFLVRKEVTELAAQQILKAYLLTWSLVIKQLSLPKVPHKMLTDCVINESRCNRKYAASTIKTQFSEFLEIGRQFKSTANGDFIIVTDPSEMLD